MPKWDENSYKPDAQARNLRGSLACASGLCHKVMIKALVRNRSRLSEPFREVGSRTVQLKLSFGGFLSSTVRVGLPDGPEGFRRAMARVNAYLLVTVWPLNLIVFPSVIEQEVMRPS